MVYLGHGANVHGYVVAKGDAAPPARRHAERPARRALIPRTAYNHPYRPWDALGRARPTCSLHGLLKRLPLNFTFYGTPAPSTLRKYF